MCEYLCNEIIWNNKHVPVDGKTIMNKKWYNKGIIQVKDLISSNGHILTITELQEKHNVQIDFLEYQSVIIAIPKNWLELTVVKITRRS